MGTTGNHLRQSAETKKIYLPIPKLMGSFEYDQFILEQASEQLW